MNEYEIKTDFSNYRNAIKIATSGIYLLVNKKNNIKYVGESINIRQRMNSYAARKKQLQQQPKLYAALKASELSDWDIYVLEYVEDSNKIKLLEQEEYWIGKLETRKDGLNCNPFYKNNYYKLETFLEFIKTKLNPRIPVFISIEPERGNFTLQLFKIDINLKSENKFNFHDMEKIHNHFLSNFFAKYLISDKKWEHWGFKKNYNSLSTICMEEISFVDLSEIKEKSITYSNDRFDLIYYFEKVKYNKEVIFVERTND